MIIFNLGWDIRVIFFPHKMYLLPDGLRIECPGQDAPDGFQGMSDLAGIRRLPQVPHRSKGGGRPMFINQVILILAPCSSHH
ncbi:hypothetical protein B6U90_03800 [Thermoplasmatales archaeon ex4484_6]|nr:MAG: hypothetical protein B6U90_03800 [Thermoplasmatales archaeon ex4484_6]